MAMTRISTRSGGAAAAFCYSRHLYSPRSRYSTTTATTTPIVTPHFLPSFFQLSPNYSLAAAAAAQSQSSEPPFSSSQQQQQPPGTKSNDKNKLKKSKKIPKPSRFTQTVHRSSSSSSTAANKSSWSDNAAAAVGKFSSPSRKDNPNNHDNLLEDDDDTFMMPPPPPPRSSEDDKTSNVERKKNPVFQQQQLQQLQQKQEDSLYNPDRMWKSRHGTKSIEELEAIMANRWGTDLSRWTAQDHDDDDEDDDDDENYEKTSKSSKSSFPSSTQRHPSAVIDPWLKEELQQQEEQKKNQQQSSSSSSSWMMPGGNANDAILRRVQKNQQNLKQQQQQQQQVKSSFPIPPTTPLQKNGSTKKNNNWQDSVNDLDLEDDEDLDIDEDDDDDDDDDWKKQKNTVASNKGNHQLQPTPNKMMMNFDHVIARKPAGGRGTNAVVSDQDVAVNDDKDNFFFVRPQTDAASTSSAAAAAAAARANQDNGDENTNDNPTATATTTKRRKLIESSPLLDDKGRPLFLTTEQAQRNFQAFLKSQQANDTDVATSDESLDMSSSSSSPSSFTTKSWQDLGITHPQLLQNLQKMKCPTPLTVQEKACPAILQASASSSSSQPQDVVVGMYTGSGKTLAFLVPLLQRLLSENQDPSSSSTDDESMDPQLQQQHGAGGVQVLIVAPGRELASQIVSVARELTAGTTLHTMLAIGGTTFGRNLELIRKRKPAILVGTPGRLAELMVGKPGEKVGRLRVSQSLQALVLDEFDALLEYKPHADPTRGILELLQPAKNRKSQPLQTILCSATASDMLQSSSKNNKNKNDILERFLRPGFLQVMPDADDVLVTGGTQDGATSSTTATTTTRVSRTVIHGTIHVPHKRLALETLRRILHTEPIPQQVLIFVENARKVTIVVDKLAEMGIIAAPLHGGMNSEKSDRAEVNKAFREGFVGLVVATELAARGLDAPLLTHVINLDLPTDASHYAHRAGRCGRGGRPGVVINLTTQPQERKVPFVKFAAPLGIDNMYTVEVRNGKLNVIDPDTQVLDSQE